MNVILNAVGVFLYREILCYPTERHCIYFVNNMVGDIISASFSIDMTMSLYLFLDMYLHSGEYHVGTVG